MCVVVFSPSFFPFLHCSLLCSLPLAYHSPLHRCLHVLCAEVHFCYTNLLCWSSLVVSRPPKYRLSCTPAKIHPVTCFDLSRLLTRCYITSIMHNNLLKHPLNLVAVSCRGGEWSRAAVSCVFPSVISILSVSVENQ